LINQIAERNIESTTEAGSRADAGFVERLRALIAIAGSASALAKKAGISQSGLHRYLSGGEPTRKVLIALAEAGGVDVAWLTGGRGSVMEKPEKTEKPIVGLETLTRVLLYRHPEAPEAQPAQPGILTGVAFCRSWLGRNGFDAKQLTAASMHGNSMEPTIRNGDNLLIDISSKDVQDGDIYAIRDGERLLIKRLQRQLGGHVRMISDNALYPMIEAPLAEVDVVGRVVWRGSLL
jgi:phage repressor protein C with HTH and peptisase S24 domain